MPTTQLVISDRVEFEVNDDASEDEEEMAEGQRGDSGSTNSSNDDPKDAQQVPLMFESTV